MENTKVFLYGSWEIDKRLIADAFDWRKILSKSDLFIPHKYNSSDFTFEQKYACSAHKKSIHMHPCSADIVAHIDLMLKTLLEKAVSEYYHCTCHISGYNNGNFVVSMLKKPEVIAYGIRTGEIIEFGRYPQGRNSEMQPIRWRVLNVEEDTALLMTEDCLIMSGYCDAEKAYGKIWYLMWGNCLAREVCNGQFYYQAFDSNEREIIRPKRMREPVYGPECMDKVFLLSEGEAVLYMDAPEKRRAKLSLRLQFPETDRKAFHDPHEEECTAWWLLPEEGMWGPIYPKAVWPNGEIQFHSRNAYHGDFTIRPCILIDLERYDKWKAKTSEEELKKKVVSNDNKKDIPGHSIKEAPAHGRQNIPYYIKTAPSYPKISGGKAYSLAYIQGYEGAPRENRPGARTAYHDKVLGKWRLTIQLDSARVWFLSVFVNDDGTFDKFCLDYEMASDSHYEFRNEAGLRKSIYCPGDEKKYLAEVLIRYVQTYGGGALLSKLYPFITAQFHYD